MQLERYIKHNSLQLQANIQCLQEYDQNATWRFQCKSVIDIGSGDGSFTSNVLEEILPDSCQKIVGCDKEKKMVQHANKNYRTRHITFEVLDIAEPIPEERYHNFDHAFSFFAIHWARDQMKVFENIYKLLAPGGSCFLVILGRISSFFETFRILFNNTKWTHYLFNAENIISPYHDSESPVDEVKKIMYDVGFTEIQVSCRNTKYSFKNIEDFQECVKAVNTFRIPEEDLNEYLNDFVRIAQDNGYINDNYEIDYDVIVARGKH